MCLHVCVGGWLDESLRSSYILKPSENRTSSTMIYYSVYLYTTSLSCWDNRIGIHDWRLANHLFDHMQQIRSQLPYLDAQIYLTHTHKHTVYHIYPSLKYDSIRYNTICYDKMRCDAMWYDTVQYNMIWYNSVPYTMGYSKIEHDCNVSLRINSFHISKQFCSRSLHTIQLSIWHIFIKAIKWTSWP